MAENHAQLWPMIAGCARHQVDLQRYLLSVLAKIGATADDELKYFLPDAWKVEYATEHFPEN